MCTDHLDHEPQLHRQAPVGRSDRPSPRRPVTITLTPDTGAHDHLPAPTAHSGGRPGGRLSERMVGFAREHLPMGHALTSDSFAERHRVAQWALACTLCFLATVGFATGKNVVHVGLDLLPVSVPALISWRSKHRLVAMLAASWGLMACASVLVHQTNGLIEAHFMFFVMLPLVAIYQDWRAFTGSVGFVVVSHAVVGIVAPDSMYNHPAAIAHPVRWAVVHGMFVAALVVVLIVEWRFADSDRRRTQRALDELHLAQNMLVQAEKLESIGQLAAGVAHEINTPVQYLSDNSRFLAESFGDLLVVIDRLEQIARAEHADDVDAFLERADLEFLRDEIPKALEQSHEGLTRVSEIVRAMKDFSHPGSELAAADLNRAISSTVTVSRNEWKYVADVDLRLDPSLPPVRCHEGQIKQVVLNLLVNAAHAIGDSGHEGIGTIVVTTSTVDNMARITLSDDGSGMPADVQARIFDPFFTTKEVGRGTGQGLSVAHRIIGAHGGAISVASTLGAGTTFTLDLPLAGPALLAVAADPVGAGGSR
jgi:signal transduction histidine kinase